MPEIIDWQERPRQRRLFFIILAVLLVIIFGGRTALPYYVESLWFGSLGYSDVFRKNIDPSVARISGVLGGHISRSIRLVSRAAVDVPARIAERQQHLNRRTIAQITGRPHSGPRRALGFARHRPNNRRQPHDGVADVRAVLVCATRHG
jgi:hypothetical protein